MLFCRVTACQFVPPGEMWERVCVCVCVCCLNPVRKFSAYKHCCWQIQDGSGLGGCSVTKQTGVHPRGTLVNDPTIDAGRNRSLFTIFQPWVLREFMLGVILSHKTQHFPCSSKGYKPKPSPIVPPFLIVSQLCKHLTAALSFRIWGTLSSAST